MDAEWIDEADALEDFCREIDGGPVGVDTESDHYHAYQARVCLFQVAHGDREALVDPLVLDARELQPLFEVLEDPEIVTILHSARNDIKEIDRDYGVGVENLFDTQIAARFLGTDGFGLNWMLEELIGVDTGDQFKRFDWTTRPIPPEARRYALDDVRYLDELREGFGYHLQEQGWLSAFRQQCRYVAGSVTYQANEFDPEGWRSLNGSDGLDGRGRTALQALYRWRHEICEETNQSAVTFFPNGALMRLSARRPKSASGVADVGGVPGDLAEDYGEQIAEVLREAEKADAPPEDRPHTSGDRPPPGQSARYHALREWRNATAENIGIPTEFIATNDTLSAIAADPPDDLEELAAFQAMLPWQVEHLGEDMLEVLRKAE